MKSYGGFANPDTQEYDIIKCSGKNTVKINEKIPQNTKI